MPSDRTRASHDLPQRYKAVVMQQGRVILDRDFNAFEEIVDGLIAANALEAIGPCGTPDDGFAIAIPTSGPSASLGPSASGQDPYDFLISPGTMYVGGQRVVLPAPGPNQPLWSHSVQPDWVDPLQTDKDASIPPDSFSFGGSYSSPMREYVYLHVYEQEVSAVEDPDLLDVALGGPDTTQRVRLMWRVHRMAVNATDPATALAAAAANFAARGLALDTLKTMRLTQQVQIQVTPLSIPTSSSPCDSVAQGGYLGADNQLIRVQIVNDPVTNTPQLLWGYDNASFLYRAQWTASQVVAQNPQATTITLKLLESPVDAYHAPQARQVVEVLQTAAILGKEPDETAPAGESTIVRCVAERTGFVTTVSTPYNNSDNSVVLNGTLPAGYPQAGDPSGNPLFLRVWQGQQPIVWQVPQPSAPNQLSQPISLTDPVTQLPLGIQVTISVPQGGALPVGAFWMIAVRPGTPQLVYPEQYLTDWQWPDGPRNWVCPLALINWLGQGSFSGPGFSAPAAVTDCRNHFANLVELTSRTWGDQVNVNGVYTLGSPVSSICNGSPPLELDALQNGLQISLNQDIDPTSATPAACFVTLDLPYLPTNGTKPIAYERVVLAANVTTRDPSTIVWSPSLTWWSSLESFILTNLGLGSFDRDWDTIPPVQPGGMNWIYSGQGTAVLQGTISSSGFTESTAISSQTVKQGVTSLSALVHSLSSSVEIGVVFNVSNVDYWLFGFSPLPAASGIAPVVTLANINLGGTTKWQSTFTIPTLAAKAQSVTFEIVQGNNALSYFVTVAGNQVGPISFPSTPAAQPPTALVPGSNVGLAVSGASGTPISVEFSTLNIGYGPASQVLLPADFRLQLTLTVKRNFLHPALSVATATQRPSTFSAPCPDFSVGFWLVPTVSSGQSVHGSVPSSSRP